MKSKLCDHVTDARLAIVVTARSYLGTRFRHQGRMPGCGLDCLGVIACTGKALGLVSHDVLDYPRLPPDGETLRREIARAGFTAVDVADARPGDVYLMRVARYPQHVALLTDCGILHAWMEARAVVEHGLDDLWRKRIVAAYQFPGVA